MSSQPEINDLAARLDSCRVALEAYRETAATDDADIQGKALQSLRQAAQRLERSASTPKDQLAVIRGGWQQAAILRVGIAIDIFQHVSGTHSPSVTQLAERTNATPEFVHRIARGLAALDVLEETHQRPQSSERPSVYDGLAYTSTALGAYVASQPDQQASLSYVFDTHVPALCAMSDYMELYGRQSPSDPLNCPVVFSQGAKDTDYFAQMQKRPDRVEKFERVMYLMNQASFADMASAYPFETLTAPDDGGGGVVLVDVGGGDGRMLKRLRERFPGMKGKAVLQDLPAVLEQGTVVAEMQDVNVMAYDFFAGEQPVRGAAAYFHQHIFHDWPDAACRTILRNLRPAMSSSSRLLLSEMIVEDVNPGLGRCAADVNMMAIGGRERSKAQWTELLGSEGFRVKGFYGEGNAVNGVVEAMKDERWRATE